MANKFFTSFLSRDIETIKYYQGFSRSVRVYRWFRFLKPEFIFFLLRTTSFFPNQFFKTEVGITITIKTRDKIMAPLMLPRISAKNVQNLCNEYAACDDNKEIIPIAKAANNQPLLLNNTYSRSSSNNDSNYRILFSIVIFPVHLKIKNR